MCNGQGDAEEEGVICFPEQPSCPLAAALSSPLLSAFCHPERSRGICQYRGPFVEMFFVTEQGRARARSFSPLHSRPLSGCKAEGSTRRSPHRRQVRIMRAPPDPRTGRDD